MKLCTTQSKSRLNTKSEFGDEGGAASAVVHILDDIVNMPENMRFRLHPAVWPNIQGVAKQGLASMHRALDMYQGGQYGLSTKEKDDMQWVQGNLMMSQMKNSMGMGGMGTSQPIQGANKQRNSKGNSKNKNKDNIHSCAGESCCNSGEYLKKCSGCLKTYYCSTECQKKSWKTHKKVWKTL